MAKPKPVCLDSCCVPPGFLAELKSVGYAFRATKRKKMIKLILENSIRRLRGEKPR